MRDAQISKLEDRDYILGALPNLTHSGLSGSSGQSAEAEGGAEGEAEGEQAGGHASRSQIFGAINARVMAALRDWVLDESRRRLEMVPSDVRGTSNELRHMVSLLFQEGMVEELVELQGLAQERWEACRYEAAGQEGHRSNDNGKMAFNTHHARLDMGFTLYMCGSFAEAEGCFREVIDTARRHQEGERLRDEQTEKTGTDEIGARSDEVGARSDDIGARSDEVGARSDEIRAMLLLGLCLLSLCLLAGPGSTGAAVGAKALDDATAMCIEATEAFREEASRSPLGDHGGDQGTDGGAFGKERPELKILTFYCLAEVLRRRGRADEAAAELLPALEEARRWQGHNMFVLRAEQVWALVQHDRGDVAGGTARMREVVEIMCERLGHSFWMTTMAKATLDAMHTRA